MAESPIFFIGRNEYFQGVLVITELWKTIGWNSIVYLAAMTGIDPELYEAATVDGANWHHKILHVTLPGNCADHLVDVHSALRRIA